MICFLLFISSVFSGSFFDYDLDSFRDAGPYEFNFTTFSTNHSITFNAKAVPNASKTEYSDCNMVDFSDGEYICYGQVKNISYFLFEDEDGVVIRSRVGYEMEATIYLKCSESNLTVVDYAYANSYDCRVNISSPFGCTGSGPGLPKASTAKCEKPAEVVFKFIGVKNTFDACKKGCFATEYDEEGYNETSCVECSFLKEESECNSYATCHYSNGKCGTNTCQQLAKDVEQEADDELAECLKEADEYEDSDERDYCQYEHDHPGRLTPWEEQKVERLLCHRIHGCMYNKDKVRCSVMPVWAFIVTLAVSITVVLTIAVVVVVCCYVKRRRGDYGAINNSD